jgi:peptidoglycan/xylan/chitin deacetylase (PgdA/CDA1 family)
VSAGAGGTLVLLYHRVIQLERDPHGLAVRPDRFAQHCEMLRRRCDVVPLGAALQPGRQVAITFDDGYADNAIEARRLLAAAGLPATFFITVGRVGERAEAWWDRLEQIVLGLETAARAIEVALFWRLRPLRLAAIDSVLADLQAQLGVRSVDRETQRWMTAEELNALSRDDGIDIGAHTVTHPFLPALEAEEQWREIDGSRRLLEQMLHSAPAFFSYPYGGHDAVDAVSTRLVGSAGYAMAFTASGGIARSDGDPLRIPRNVVGDWDAGRFEHWLDHWLGEL